MNVHTTISNYPQSYVGISWIDATEIFRQVLDVLDKGTIQHYQMFKAYLLAINNPQITQPFLDVTNQILEQFKSDTTGPKETRGKS